MHRGVGVVHRHAFLGEHLRRGRLAHADRAGQTEDEHVSPPPQPFVAQEVEQRQQRQAENGEVVALDRARTDGCRRPRADSRRRSAAPRRRPRRDSRRESGRRESRIVSRAVSTISNSTLAVAHQRAAPNAAHGSCPRSARNCSRGRRRDRPAWRSAARRAPASDRRRARGAPASALPPPHAPWRRASSARRSGRHRARRLSPRRARSSMPAGRISNRQAGRRQNLPPHLAFRGEHQAACGAIQSGMLKRTGGRRRSARSFITAAAVSSIERRVTSISGQSCLAQSRRE